MPVYKVVRWETCSQTVYIRADSIESAEKYANHIEEWTQNQDISYEYNVEQTDSNDYDPSEIINI